MTLAPLLLCPYFDNPDNKVDLKDPEVWVFPVTDLGVDGVEILHKQYGFFKDTTDNNIGRAEGTDPAQVLVIKEDVEGNGIDYTCPPVFVDIDTGDFILSQKKLQNKLVNHDKEITKAKQKVRLGGLAANFIGKKNLQGMTKLLHNNFKSIPVYLETMPKVQSSSFIDSNRENTKPKVLLLPACPNRIFASSKKIYKVSKSTNIRKAGF